MTQYIPRVGDTITLAGWSKSEALLVSEIEGDRLWFKGYEAHDKSAGYRECMSYPIENNWVLVEAAPYPLNAPQPYPEQLDLFDPFRGQY